MFLWVLHNGEVVPHFSLFFPPHKINSRFLCSSIYLWYLFKARNTEINKQRNPFKREKKKDMYPIVSIIPQTQLFVTCGQNILFTVLIQCNWGFFSTELSI